jgi:TetR/AcrR family transcriptional regulator
MNSTTRRSRPGDGAEEWHRARRPEQKQARTDTILAAARNTIDSVGIDQTTLSAIAREANLSKANCYRYFENREAILLELVLEETAEWSDVIIDNLSSLEDRGNLEAVAQVLVGVTLERPRLCELASSLWSVLEQNVSEDVLADFKRNFHQVSQRWLDPLTDALPAMTEDQAREFARFFLLFIASAWPASKPSSAMELVMALPEFKNMKVDLKAMVYSHTLTILKGMLK